MKLTAQIAICALFATGAGPAAAKPPTEATFALIVGVNKSVDKDLKRLHYADDDAARYFELFRLLNAKTYLLTRLDASSRRVHAQAAAEAKPPKLAQLRKTVAGIRADVAHARSRGVRTALYVIYAGHGNSAGARGYVSLEDGRLDGAAIAKDIIGLIGADASHVIVDACNSYLLALGRGPGGKRRALSGFSRLAGTLRAKNVGLLLSTSSAKKSHEWEGFQAGVFSHAVRSGLYGAADADGDGQVSYREIAAFVEHANRAIPNERFRSRVFTREPSRSSVLVDLRSRLKNGIDLPAKHHGRYLLEDTRGVRLADFHSASGQRVRLVRHPARRLYLYALATDKEYAILPGERRVDIGALASAPPRTRTRGAANHAFRLLFKLPYDQRVVAEYRPAPLPRRTVDTSGRSRGNWRRLAAWSALAVSLAASATAIAHGVSASNLRADAPLNESHVDRVARNDSISTRNTTAAVFYVGAGAAAATSLLLFLWPDAHARDITVGAAATPAGGQLSFSSSF